MDDETVELANKLFDVLIAHANSDVIIEILDDIRKEQRRIAEDLESGNYIRAIMRQNNMTSMQLLLIWTVLKEQREVWIERMYDSVKRDTAPAAPACDEEGA